MWQRILPTCLAVCATAIPALAQDDPPLPPVSTLLGGTVIFACALIDGNEPGVELFTFRRPRNGNYQLLEEGRDLPATFGNGVFIAFDQERLTSFHISNGASSALIGQVHQPMICDEVTQQMRQTLRRLSRE